MQFLGALTATVIYFLTLVGPVHAQDKACSSGEIAIATNALKDGEKALDQAIAALANPTDAQLDLLASWLGVRSSSAAAIVRDKLIRTRAFTSQATFRCAIRTDAKLGDVYAYVRGDRAFVIVLATFFFDADDRGFSSKPGILVHEMSHFLLAGATLDPRIYGTDAAKALAASNPTAAQSNAENYEYFVEALYFGL